MRFQSLFVHIECPVYLDLQGVETARRPTVMFGDETAGIGLVARNRIAKISEAISRPFRQFA